MVAPQRKGGRPTLKDIAYITGLGVTTVSRALNDAPDIGKATKARVRLVAQQIGYRPNRAGVRLRTGKTNVISIILNTEEEVMGMTASMLNGLAKAIGETTYHLVLTPYNLDQDPLDPVKYVVETGSADGIILSRTQPNDPRVRYLTEQKFPFVTHGRTNMGLEHAYFDYDNQAYAASAVAALTARGRQQIGLIAPPNFMTYSTHMLEGLHTELEKHNLVEVPIRNINTDSTANQIEAEILRIMMSKQPLDGIICASPHSAMAAIAAVETSGRVIGKDVDIVAKETFDLLNRFRPDLIVFEESFKSAGYALGKMVISIINGDEPSKHQMLENPKR
ncbi:MAG: LacI family DNA-binding transcriptional regulator [Rhizobiales bacterium]|nr:LacI family DNA-binding transcriptional regulator [Hyphomicrobiales bacterium]